MRLHTLAMTLAAGLILSWGAASCAPPCAEDETRRDGRCVRMCNYDAECGEGYHCESGVCASGVSTLDFTPPSVEGSPQLDRTFLADGSTATHRPRVGGRWVGKGVHDSRVSTTLAGLLAALEAGGDQPT
jgi:hypothetical protein